VANAKLEQSPEYSQNERASLHPEPDVKRRETKYRKEFARIAKAMCRQGATDYELAQGLRRSARLPLEALQR
jgi:hypothetical protein